MDKIPTDTCIRQVLDPVAPEYCFPVYADVHRLLEQRGVLDREYRTLEGGFLLALDGRTTFYHSAITPVFVRSGTNRVIAVDRKRAIVGAIPVYERGPYSRRQ